jgi:hypothetical protein
MKGVTLTLTIEGQAYRSPLMNGVCFATTLAQILLVNTKVLKEILH